jgi:hypothetical protein
VFVLAAAQSVVKVSSWKDLKSKIDNQAGQSFLLTSPFDIAGAAQIVIKAFQHITITGEDGVVLDGKNLPVMECFNQQLFLNHGGSLDVSGITFRNLQCGFLQNGIELYPPDQPVTTVSNCVFDNAATGYGQTVNLLTNGAAFTNCAFENHFSKENAVLTLSNFGHTTDTVLSNCIFRNNTATRQGGVNGPAGGAIYVWTSNATLRLRGCQFILPSNASLGHNDITMATFAPPYGPFPPGKGEWAPSADRVQKCSRSINCLTYFDLLPPPQFLHLDPIHKLIMSSSSAAMDLKALQ